MWPKCIANIHIYYNLIPGSLLTGCDKNLEDWLSHGQPFRNLFAHIQIKVALRYK